MASDDDYSDLTELESEDDDEPTKKKSKGEDSGKGGYRIRNALKVPRATTYTAQALYDQIHSNDINLEPEYQRDVVWSEAKQIGVIDSIYRNFYIPPIIFAVNCHEDGSETKTCIDGKQRLTSIYKFMDGLIPHRDSETGEKHWYKDSAQPSRPKRKILSPKYRKMFANKQIVCVEYQEINDAAEREIFQRVQLGMALTPAEKLQVIKTKRADFIRDLQNTFLKEEGLLCGGALEWDTGRGSDYRCLAQSVYDMDQSNTREGMKPSSGIQQTEKWLNSKQGFSPEFEISVRDAFTVFANMVQDKKHNHVFKKPAKVSPIEFIMMGVMIYLHKGEASMAQLAAGIAQMRTDIRETHVDIRMNTRVTKDLIDFVTKWKPPTIPGDAGVPIGNTSVTIGIKRKRPPKNGDDMDVDEVDDAMDEDDESYGTPKSKKANKKTANGSTSSSAPKVKAEPASTPLPTTMPLPFYPPTDRLAALRRAKDAVKQRQAERQSQNQSQNANANPNQSQSQSQSQSQAQAPSTSRTSGLATPNSANDHASPQMLPSPGLPFSFPSSSTQPQQQQRMVSSTSSSSQLPLPNATASGSSAPTTIRIPPLGQSASTNNVSTNSPIVGSANNVNNRIPPSSSSSSSRANASVLPPPPSSASSLASDRDREDRDRDSRSREPERQRPSFSLPPRRR